MFQGIQVGISDFISNLASFVAVSVELIGVIVIVISIVRFLYRAVAVHKFNIEKIHKDKTFNASLSVALEIILASEILKTITLNGDFNDLIEVVLLIVVRILMALVLHFENKS